VVSGNLVSHSIGGQKRGWDCHELIWVENFKDVLPKGLNQWLRTVPSPFATFLWCDWPDHFKPSHLTHFLLLRYIIVCLKQLSPWRQRHHVPLDRHYTVRNPNRPPSFYEPFSLVRMSLTCRQY
jgi:hypothetical protein